MRRLLRFRLRSFFLLIALLGIVVYPIASEWQAVRREQAAIGTFAPYTVRYEPAISPIARWVALPLSYLEPLAGQRVQRLVIERDWGDRRKTTDLSRLGELQQLRQLEINDSLHAKPLAPGQRLNRSVRTLIVRQQGRRETMHWLSGLPDVQSLAIRGSQLSSPAVESIAQMRVRSLEISCYEAPLSGLGRLAKCRSLRSLKLYDAAAKSAPQLLAELPHLESLTVGDWRSNDLPRPSYEVQFLAPLHITQLKELTIEETRLDPDNTERLALQTNLRTLHLAAARLTAPAAERLRALRSLRSLSVHAAHVDADAWPEIGQLSQLRHLELRGVVTSAKYFDCLRSLTELEQLELHHGRLDDAAAQILISLPVKRLTLRYVVMTPKTRQWLEAQQQGPALTMVN